jgi:hypothetical protein
MYDIRFTEARVHYVPAFVMADFMTSSDEQGRYYWAFPLHMFHVRILEPTIHILVIFVAFVC